ncbi:hypothetical protein DLAC_01939, partial [Tieghemostelium lacteum]
REEFIQYYQSVHIKQNNIVNTEDQNKQLNNIGNNNNNINNNKDIEVKVDNNNNNNNQTTNTTTTSNTTNNNNNNNISINNNISDSKLIEDSKALSTAIVTKKAIEKCQDPSHSKLANQYCTQCNLTICQHCQKKHSNDSEHQLVTYEESYDLVYQDSKDYINLLLEQLRDTLSQKTLREQVFKDTISDYYDSQLETITNHFREIHDLLHFREVELKRELKSYHDENVEIQTTILSKLDHDMEQTNHKIRDIQHIQSQQHDKPAFVKLFTDKYINSKELKRDFPVDTAAAATTTATANINNMITSGDIEFRKFSSMSELSTKNIHNNILALKLLKIKNKKVIDHLIRFNWNRGVERINFKTNESEILLDENAQGNPNKPNGGYIFQSDLNRGILFIFDENTYYRLDTRVKNPEWKIGDIPVNSMRCYCPSSVYDGKDYIYIVGGYVNGKDSAKNIFRFNVNTEETELIGDLSISSRWHGLTYHDEYIYVCGGYNATNQYLNRIDRFHVKTCRVENVVENLESFGVTQLKSGCYVAPTQSYYLFTRDSLFYRYDAIEKKCVKLVSPFTKAPVYDLKLCYNGQHNIYLIVTRGLSLYKYNTLKDKWTTYQDIFKYVPTSSDDYIQFQMIN